ncbi:MAG: NPCBM/NEW2 domain-containing protein [Pirellulaceae bacterium]
MIRTLISLTIFAMVLCDLSDCFAQTRTVAETIDGERKSISFDQITDAGRFVDANGNDLGLSLSGVMSLDFDGASEDVKFGFPKLLLHGGSQFSANEFTFDGEVLGFRSRGIRSPISASAVIAVVFVDSVAVQQTLLNESTQSDQIVVDKDGNSVILEGVIETIADGKLGINYEGRSRSISLEKIQAIVFAKLGIEKQTGSIVECKLRSGGSIVGQLNKWNQGTVDISVSGATLLVDAASIAAVDVRSDRMVFVSALEPVEVEQTMQFAPQRSWQRNRSVESNPLTLSTAESPQGQVFRRGIGTQSYSRLVFENDGGFNRLGGVVGIDIETRGRGACIVSIRGDGIPLWNAEIDGESLAKEFDVAIDGIERIELIVEPGKQMDLADHVDWVNIRMLRIDD